MNEYCPECGTGYPRHFKECGQIKRKAEEIISRRKLFEGQQVYTLEELLDEHYQEEYDNANKEKTEL